MTVSPSNGPTPTCHADLQLFLAQQPSLRPAPAAKSGLLRILGVYPVPSNGPVTLVYSLREPAQLIFNIYNVAGEKVWSTGLSSDVGTHALPWPAATGAGAHAASGLYLLHLSATSANGDQDGAWAKAALKR